MNHLTDEQLELAMQDLKSAPCHLAECRICSDRLLEKQALAARLRSAFSGVHASSELAEQVARRIRVRASTGKHNSQRPGKAHSPFKPWWIAAAAVAAVIPLAVLLMMPSSVMAAKAELAQIHAMNLDPDHTFVSNADPAHLAAYFKRNLGFDPIIPRTGQGLSLRGCCVQYFKGRQTGSYVVDTPDGIMSIIVVQDMPDDIGINTRFEKDGTTFYRSAFAQNNMVCVRIGVYTYCAVGEVSHEFLTSLLSQLLADTQPN